MGMYIYIYIYVCVYMYEKVVFPYSLLSTGKPWDQKAAGGELLWQVGTLAMPPPSTILSYNCYY